MTAAAQSPAQPELRLGARVLLLDPHDRVLLIHARDPDDPDCHWWELPGGGLGADEPAPEAARRVTAPKTPRNQDREPTPPLSNLECHPAVS